jgi:nucleotidyltransferase substrate binding protein (TIGR01987 family)
MRPTRPYHTKGRTKCQGRPPPKFYLRKIALIILKAERKVPGGLSLGAECYRLSNKKMDEDIRWKQRFNNYKKAFSHLDAAVHEAKMRPLTDLEQQGLVKAFEFTFELAWNVMKDFLTMKGITGIIGSKDAVRYALREGLISDGAIWMRMINDRNHSSHVYDESTKDSLVKNIVEEYHAEFAAFAAKMEELSSCTDYQSIP